MESPLISILVPVYGVEKCMERCVRTLFGQTYANLEFIFVDDCTPDRSISIIENVLKEYPLRQKAVRIIHHACNRGLSAARNTAVEAAKGVYIMHVDSDDWIELDAVERLLERQIETGADIVSGDVLIHLDDGCELFEEPDYCSKDEMLNMMVRINLNHVLWKRLIKTALYKDNEVSACEGVNCSEDMQVMSKLVYFAGSFAKLDAVVYHYDCCAVGLTHSAGNNFNMRKYLDDVKSLELLKEFFGDKDERCVRILEEELENYREHCRIGAVRKYDYEAYKKIVSDMTYSNISYWPELLLVIICKAIRKVTGVSVGPLNR